MKAPTIVCLSALLGLSACSANLGDSPGGSGATGSTTGGTTGPGGTTTGPGGTTTGPGGTTTGGGMCNTNTPTRIWRLSDEQFSHAVSDLFPGIPVPDVETPGKAKGELLNFSETFPVTGAIASNYRTSAKAVAAGAVKSVTTLLGCKTGQADLDCVGAYIDRLAPRAFRRPIDMTERTALVTVYQLGAMTSQADGVRMVIEAVLQSPSFLYRTELGASTVAAGMPTALTPFELAASLSFLVLDSIPDDTLWAAAMDGTLAQPAVFTREATRLLATPRAATNLSRVLIKWLGIGNGITTELATAMYPEYTDALKASMLEETNRFLSGLVTKNATVTDLMTSRATFVDNLLAPIYGVPYPAGSTGFVPVMLPNERAGILTQAGIVTAKSRGHQIVIRGKFVRRELLCQDIPAPPPTINIMQFSSLGLTERQQSAKRVSDPVCGMCHSLMDPIGISFEKFDVLGRFKPTAADGTMLDSAGQLTLTDVDGPINSPVELATALGKSTQARECVSQKMLVYAIGRDLAAADECEQSRVAADVQNLGGHLPDLIAAIVRSPAFAYRIGGQ